LYFIGFNEIAALRGRSYRLLPQYQTTSKDPTCDPFLQMFSLIQAISHSSSDSFLTFLKIGVLWQRHVLFAFLRADFVLRPVLTDQQLPTQSPSGRFRVRSSCDIYWISSRRDIGASRHASGFFPIYFCGDINP
jgi:hypothetical protein